MKNIFSYDSKFMNMLGSVADSIILNVMFLICCLPVVTIGAAFTALFSACRALAEDGAPYRAFFKGLRSGFVRSTLAWLVLLPVLVLLALTSYTVFYYMKQEVALGLFTFIISLVGLFTVLCVTSMVFLFYSRFECTLRQLLKNGLLMHLAYLIRSTIIGVLNWMPVLAFFLMPDLFLQLGLIWLFLYSGVAGNLSVWLMKKPFDKLTEEVEGVPAPEEVEDQEDSPVVL